MSVEEWWGKTFEARGSLSRDGIPEGPLAPTLQKLSTEDVAELYRSQGVHDHPSVIGIMAGIELRRRENWTGRAALLISLLALVVSAVF